MSNEMKVSYALSGQIERRFYSSLFFSSKSISARRRSYTSLRLLHGREMSFCIYSGKGDGIRRLEREKTSPSETRLAPLFLQWDWQHLGHFPSHSHTRPITADLPSSSPSAANVTAVPYASSWSMGTCGLFWVETLLNSCYFSIVPQSYAIVVVHGGENKGVTRALFGRNARLASGPSQLSPSPLDITALLHFTLLFIGQVLTYGAVYCWAALCKLTLLA